MKKFREVNLHNYLEKWLLKNGMENFPKFKEIMLIHLYN